VRETPLSSDADRTANAAGKRATIRLAPAGALGNGHYRALVTAQGTGASFLDGVALTRWRADALEDGDGFRFYLRDLDSGKVCALGGGDFASDRAAAWSPGRFTLEREALGLAIHLDVCVAPQRAFEIRRVTLRDLRGSPRRLAVCSYVEVALNEPGADLAHPAFSKLFVQTEWVAERRAWLARRRPRASGERHPVMVHALLGEGPVEHESDRARFLGRGGSFASPRALTGTGRLSGTVGNVLDPALCLSRTVELSAGATTTLTFVLGAAESRDDALRDLSGLEAPTAVDGTFDRAAAVDREVMRTAGVDETQARTFHALASALSYANPALRAAPDVLARAHGATEPPGVLGPEDAPWILLDATLARAAAALPELIAAREYGRSLGFPFRLLVLSESGETLGPSVGGGSGVAVIRPSDLSPEERDRLASVASWFVTGDPIEVANPIATPESLAEIRASIVTAHGSTDGNGLPAEEALFFFNGHGGFHRDGREYVVRIRDAHTRPPAPWVNVIANESFGCLVSESGATTTWSQNSREHRLTPWSNDPVLDPHGEAIYVRDEDSGAFWSPMPGPAPAGAYEVRHGFGQTRFLHQSHELAQETRVFVARHDPIRFVQLRLTNRSSRPRRLSLFAYQRLVLGTTPEPSARFVTTAHDREAGALFARNRMAGEFADRVAFAAALVPGAETFVTCDRAAFLGTGGTSSPQALASSATLDGRVGAGLDPCFATQSVVELPVGGTIEASFLLGDGDGESQIRAWLAHYREPNAVARALREVTDFWDDLVSAVHVSSPSPAIDLMVNGWLAYQALSCRIWGRTAFYQSGGAFGYRDQLQDASAFASLHPELLRAQILLHAGHQFVEGDVLHWWHPPLDRGIRTRFADDLLWLPYLTAGYVQTTGDWTVFEERAAFLTARPLQAHEDETFLTPQLSGESADVYEHCCRAIDRALAVGRHGLPLFGSGDWNDGMNRVGREGKGESVWMGFFLHAVLGDFAPICERQGDRARARQYREHRERLREALNQEGWDGSWYRRGYYDDGEPLGSQASDECQIDALVQAWSVISGAAPRARALQALDEVEQRLVSDGIVRLLTPPFENTLHDPGYIKSYVRGVRENGGQYTHAALWVVRALAELGLSERAAPMLEMLSPVRHSETPEQVETYRVEPYVIAADVYGEPPHVGRGGWTWYTGSAAWMMRVALESVFGVRMVSGDTLVIRPCIPAAWPGFQLQWRVPGDRTRYEIVVRNAGGGAVRRASLDGAEVEVIGGAARVPLLRDGGSHRVEVELGAGASHDEPLEVAAEEPARLAQGGGSSHARPAPDRA